MGQFLCAREAVREFKRRGVVKEVSCKRIGEPEDIAGAAVSSASDYSDYVNGTSLYVDGGMTLYPVFTYEAAGVRLLKSNSLTKN